MQRQHASALMHGSALPADAESAPAHLGYGDLAGCRTHCALDGDSSGSVLGSLIDVQLIAADRDRGHSGRCSVRPARLASSARTCERESAMCAQSAPLEPPSHAVGRLTWWRQQIVRTALRQWLQPAPLCSGPCRRCTARATQAAQALATASVPGLATWARAGCCPGPGDGGRCNPGSRLGRLPHPSKHSSCKRLRGHRRAWVTYAAAAFVVIRPQERTLQAAQGQDQITQTGCPQRRTPHACMPACAASMLRACNMRPDSTAPAARPPVALPAPQPVELVACGGCRAGLAGAAWCNAPRQARGHLGLWRHSGRGAPHAETGGGARQAPQSHLPCRNLVLQAAATQQ